MGILPNHFLLPPKILIWNTTHHTVIEVINQEKSYSSGCINGSSDKIASRGNMNKMYPFHFHDKKKINVIFYWIPLLQL